MKYKGILARKIDSRTALLAAKVLQSGERTQARIDLGADFERRVEALFDAHDVEHGDWHVLAIKLAVAHVPGFQTEAARGPKTKWSPWDRAMLYVTIDEYRRKKSGRLSVWSVCREFAKRPKWKSKVRSRGGELQVAEALRRQYSQADKRFVDELRDIRAWSRQFTKGVAMTTPLPNVGKKSSDKSRPTGNNSDEK